MKRHTYTITTRRVTYFLFSLFFLVNFFSSKSLAFKSETINKEILETMERSNTWSENALVPANRLRLLTIKHIDFAEKEQIGSMIVLDVCAEAVLNIFKELYRKKFPIHQIKPMHYYQGKDHAALADNNTSCYIDRNVIGSTDAPKKSIHAYGLAIDINPVQNPFVVMDTDKGNATYDPVAGIQYANRMQKRLGKETRKGMAEEVIEVFARNGFYWWGGYWDTPIDYQHFQISPLLAGLYLHLEPKEAIKIFRLATDYYNKYQKPLETDLLKSLNNKNKEEINSLVEHYQRDKKNFYNCLNKLTVK